MSFRVPKAHIRELIFWPVAVIVMLNLNGFASMALGIERLFSLVIFLFFSLIIVLDRSRVRQSLGSAGIAVIGFLLVYLMFGAMVGIFKGSTLENIEHYFQVYLSSIVVITGSAIYASQSIDRDKDKKIIMGLFVLGLLSLLSIVYGYLDPSIYKYAILRESHEVRYSGFFANPNEAGVAALITAVLGFSCLKFLPKKTMASVGVVLSGLAVVSTFSRSAFIIFLVLCLYQFFDGVRGRSSQKYIMIFMCLIGITVYLFFSNYSSFTAVLDLRQARRINEISMLISGGSIENVRYGITYHALGEIAESPIFGTGLGSFHRMSEIGFGAHNLFLMLFGEVGLVLGTTFLLLLILLGLKGFRSQDGTIRVLVSSYILVFFMSANFSHNVLTDRNQNMMLGVCIGLLSARRVRRLKRSGLAGISSSSARNLAVLE